MSNKSPVVYGGLLCGMNRGKIENCTFENTNITSNVNFSLAGTITGYSTGIINNCSLKGIQVIGYDLVGGIAGTLDMDSRTTGCVVGKADNGKRSLIQLTAGTNTAGSYVAGGLCGYGFGNDIDNCLVSYTDFKLYGSTTRNPSMGHLVGHLNYGIIRYSSSIFTSIIKINAIASNTKYKQNSSYTKNFFAKYSGTCGKVEGNSTVNY